LVLWLIPRLPKFTAAQPGIAPFKDGLASRYGFFLLVEPNARARPAVRALEQWLIAQASA
jgi:LysR family glycine cleavage system transcriptional activator